MPPLRQLGSRWLQPLRQLLMRTVRGWRASRGLGPLAVTFTLTLVAGALLLTMGHERPSSPAAGPRALLVERADVHAETLLHGQELELNLAISQTGSDCQVTLHGTGETCLRFTVVLDEEPVVAGYGVIPLSDVHVTGSGIVLTVDPRGVPNFVFTVGEGGPIALTWKLPTGAAGGPAGTATVQSKHVQRATIEGHIASYVFPKSGVIASIVYQ